jgi:uncharacterized protein involved in exopolysaccharide biosynthesis
MSAQHDPSANGRSAACGPGIAAYLEVWQVVRRRKWRILAMVVLALTAGAAYALLDGPWYDATAQLLVIKKRLETTPISGPEQARAQEEYLSTHMLLVTSPRVVLQAVRKGDLQNLEQFHPKEGLKKKVADWVSHSLLGRPVGPPSEEKIAREIVRALVVGRDAQRPGVSPSNEILNISFRGKVAEDCPKVLDAVVASYREFLQETYRNTNAEALELISQARELVQKDIEAKEAAYQKFLAQTPPLWHGQGNGNTAQKERLIQIDAKLAAFRLRRAEIEAAVETLRSAVRSGRNPTVLVGRMSSPAAPADAGPPSLPHKQDPWFAERRPRVSPEEELLGLYLQEAKVLGVREANHPEALAIRKQIENVRRLLQPGSAGAAGRDRDLGQMKIELLEQEREDLQVAERQLTRLFEAEQQGVRTALLQEIQDDAHRKGIERDRALYDSIVQRLKEISTVKDFGGYSTQVIGPPERGELAIKKCLLIFGLSLFAGLLAGFGWAYLAENSSRKVARSGRPPVLLAHA